MLRLATINRHHAYIATGTITTVAWSLSIPTTLCTSATNSSLENAKTSSSTLKNDDNDDIRTSSTSTLRISSHLHHPTTTTSTTTTMITDLSSSYAILPYIQAVNRVLRLVKTISLMACDYQLDKMKTYLETRFDASSLPFSDDNENNNNNNNVDDERRYWDDELTKRSQALEKAQSEYTGGGPASEAERNGLDMVQYKKMKKDDVHRAACALAEAEEKMSHFGNNRRSEVHRIAAERLLKLCRENKGAYIKVGQHLANLDYLIPTEYISTLSQLFNDAPTSPYSDVRRVIREDLGADPDDIFETFCAAPLASASLAQVHVATERGSGRTLAVKVQHAGLRETSGGDVAVMVTAVRVLEWVFEDFTWGWLVDEIAPQLPKELDFHNEGRNAEMASSHLRQSGLDCVIPKVIWDKTSPRVLCMEFEEGFKSTDVDAIRQSGLKTSDVAKLISSIFNYQVFQSGFVHCDPHPANVLLREHPTKKGRPQVVLVDHGLYKHLQDDFRLTYAELWRALMMADIAQIKSSCRLLGVTEMYPLLAAMLTSRPFDEILERSKTNTLTSSSPKNKGDKAMIRGYAQRYLNDIISMLDTVPRQMLLLFKMNDCLRHVDFALGSPTNNLIVAGEYASQAVFEEREKKRRRREMESGRGGGVMTERVVDWIEYMTVFAKIRVYEWGLWWTNVLSRTTVLFGLRNYLKLS